MAESLADRVPSESTADPIGEFWKLTLARSPTAEERKSATAFLEMESPEQLCLALFNLSEFVYVD